MLGSLAFMTLGHEAYLPALAWTILAIALTMLLLSWVWSPSHSGYSGLGMIFSRYLLSVGLPFEQWLHYLAEVSQREADPQLFLDEAIASMSKLPLLLGGTWKSPDATGEFGKHGPNQAEFHDPQLSITLYTGFRLSPTLVWHFNLIDTVCCASSTSRKFASKSSSSKATCRPCIRPERGLRTT